MELAPEGVWPAVVEAAEFKVSRTGLRYVATRLHLADRYHDVFVNLVPWVRWRYLEQLRRLGADLQLFYEWDGVDLAEHMAEILALTLPETRCHVWVKHVEWRGETRALAELM